MSGVRSQPVVKERRIRKNDAVFFSVIEVDN